MSDEAKFKVEDKVRLKYVSPDEYFDWVKTAHEEQWIGVITAPAVYPDHTEYMVHFDAEHELTFTVDELEVVSSPHDELTRLKAENEQLRQVLAPFSDIWREWQLYDKMQHEETTDDVDLTFQEWLLEYVNAQVITEQRVYAAYQVLHIHSEKE